MDEIFDVSLTGHYCVGKTAVARRFVNNVYDDGLYIPLEFSCKTIEVETQHESQDNGNKKRVRFRVWDISSNYGFRDTRPLQYKRSHNIILLFDLSNVSSFEHVPIVYRDIKKYSSSDTIVYLAGNKCDMHAAISKREIYNLCSALGIKYYEISAKDNIGIDVLFNDMYHEATKRDLTNKLNNNKNQYSYKLEDTKTDGKCTML